MKKGILILSLLILYRLINAQPPNDNPCHALFLYGSTNCIMGVPATNVAATASLGVPAPSCSTYLGGDVWFTALVPSNGTIDIVTSAGTMTDGAMAAYSGTCGALTLIKCNEDSIGLMPAIYKSGLTVGDTIYLRMFGYNGGTGTFSICNNISTGIEELQNEETITVFPNPATTSITITTSNKIESIKMYNIVGEVIRNYELRIRNDQSATIDISSLAKGMYFAEVYFDKLNNHVVRRKVMVE